MNLSKFWILVVGAVLLDIVAIRANEVRGATYSFAGTIDSVNQNIPTDLTALSVGLPVALEVQLEDDSLGVTQASITMLNARIGDEEFTTQRGRIYMVDNNADIIDVFSGGGFFDGYNISFAFVDRTNSAVSAIDTFKTADYSKFTKGEFFVYSHQIHAPVIWATDLRPDQ